MATGTSIYTNIGQDIGVSIVYVISKSQDGSINTGFHHFQVDNMSTNFEWKLLVKVTYTYAVVSTPFKINIEDSFKIYFSRCSKKSNSFAIYCLGLILYISEFEVWSIFVSEF